MRIDNIKQDKVHKEPLKFERSEEMDCDIVEVELELLELYVPISEGSGFQYYTLANSNL